jgi:hypothetical protein
MRFGSRRTSSTNGGMAIPPKFPARTFTRMCPKRAGSDDLTPVSSVVGCVRGKGSLPQRAY